MRLASEIQLPIMPVDTAEFAQDPTPFLEKAQCIHPWLARFSQGYVAYGYHAVTDLFADEENLFAGLGSIVDYYGLRGTMWGRFMEEIVLSRTGAEHARLRASVARAFMPKRAKRARPLMQRVISDLLDEWAPRGEFDFALFASYFPVTVMCGLLGVSSEPVARLRTAIEDHVSSLSLDPGTKPRFLAAWDVLWEFADALVKERETNTEFNDESLLDSLIQAKDAGDLDEIELRFMILTMIIAGYDTSKNQLGRAMKLLFERPKMYARCAEDRDYCGEFLQESLRHSGIAVPFRTAARAFTYDGVHFQKGDLIVLAPPLAGRDPSVFPDPMDFNPARENKNRHLAFGRGAHICLGQFIAKAQLQEGLHLICQRLKKPRINGDVICRQFLGAWGFDSLPIAFEYTAKGTG